MLDFHTNAFGMPLEASKTNDTEWPSAAVDSTAWPATGRMAAKLAEGVPETVAQHARNILTN